jgi:hypothetical protein
LEQVPGALIFTSDNTPCGADMPLIRTRPAGLVAQHLLGKAGCGLALTAVSLACA